MVCITYTASRRKRKQRKMMENMSKQQLCPHIKNALPRDGLGTSVPTRGTTGLGSSSQDTKRKQRTTLDWCSCHAVSSFTERQFWDRL